MAKHGNIIISMVVSGHGTGSSLSCESRLTILVPVSSSSAATFMAARTLSVLGGPRRVISIACLWKDPSVLGRGRMSPCSFLFHLRRSHTLSLVSVASFDDFMLDMFPRHTRSYDISRKNFELQNKTILLRLGSYTCHSLPSPDRFWRSQSTYVHHHLIVCILPPLVISTFVGCLFCIFSHILVLSFDLTFSSCKLFL